MNLLLVVHGHPPGQAGGTERSVAALARGLVARGHQVTLLAGAPERAQAGCVQVHGEPIVEDGPRLVRLSRADLHFEHWHKALSPEVGRAFTALLEEHAIDVVHVHHWLRLTRDLVRRAALAGRPSVVSLHDHFVSCPLAFRIDPRSGEVCERPSSPTACVPCAGVLPPYTPWIPREEGWMSLGRRRAGLLAELGWARAISAPTRAHALAVERHLELEPGSLEIDVLAPTREALSASELEPLQPPSAGAPLRLVAWGALARAKGPDVLLEALTALGPGTAQLDLLGAFDDAQFEDRVREGAEGLAVNFHGPYERADLPREKAARAHAFVSGTRAPESFGLVLDEALELGLPVVVPATPAFVERLVDEGGELRGGLVYTQADAQDLARCLRRLAAEPGLWERLAAEAIVLGRGARARAGGVEGYELLYERARAAGAPEVPRMEAGEERMAEVFEEVWDEALRLRSPAELGFVGPDP